MVPALNFDEEKALPSLEWLQKNPWRWDTWKGVPLCSGEWAPPVMEYWDGEKWLRVGVRQEPAPCGREEKGERDGACILEEKERGEVWAFPFSGAWVYGEGRVEAADIEADLPVLFLWEDEHAEGMSEVPVMKARIRPGAIVGQDHGLGVLTEYVAGEVFDVHPFSETRVRLTARGYGESGKGSYGDGALYVAEEDVMPVLDEDLVDEQRGPYEKGAEIKVKEAPDELAAEVYRAYAYFTSQLLRLGTMTRGEIAKPGERTEMFQAWLALKLAILNNPIRVISGGVPRPDLTAP